MYLAGPYDDDSVFPDWNRRKKTRQAPHRRTSLDCPESDDKQRGRHLKRTEHAIGRQSHRGVTCAGMWATLEYGRVYHRNGAVHYVLGKREVAKNRGEVNLSDFVNLHLVCALDGTILTVYRNHKLQHHNC